MTPPIRLQSAALAVLLLATLGGCAVYDTRPPTTGSTYIDPRLQDQILSADRQLRKAKAREWHEVQERERSARFARYFDD
jgi:hypothetical protein